MAEPKRKRGRPRTTRRAKLSVRISDATRAALDAAAAAGGYSLSEITERWLGLAVHLQPDLGRPSRELLPGERVPMSFRVRPELKRTMDLAAWESGRSVAQEIEIRLEQSFRDETIVTRLTAMIIELIDKRFSYSLPRDELC